MSDIVVSFVLENLKNLLIYEANLFLGVKEQVDLLKDDLGFMISFLKDSEGKQNEDYTAKEVISQIRDATFEAEDVISMYMAQVIKQRRRNLLQKLFHSFGHATMLHDVASETTRIKNKIDNIYANKSRFGIEAGSLSHLGEDEERLPVQCRRDVEEVDMVGFDNDTTTLVHQLTDGSLQLEVTSIIGMGGVGKTTLARKIYNNSRIKNHFDCCAWVIVSQQYKTHRLLLDMMKCFMSLSDEIFKKSDEELKHKLRDNLKGRRYFVVMDDVWKPEVWDEIKAAFPDESNGSRLLITSLEKAVATHASPTPPYFLPFLDEEASWELFCKKVFRGEKCPSYLESLGRQLAESCKGLPLSIVVLGGVISSNSVKYLKWILKNFRFIRVLSVEKCSISSSIIPNGIKELIFLRYLGLSSSDDDPVVIKSIPSSICKLLYLEIIHIRGIVEKPLPKSIWMMKQLRHLNVTERMELSNPWSWTTKLLGDDDDHALSNLQVLSNLFVGPTTELLFTKSSLFPNRRKLHLSGDYRQYSELSKILASLQGSNNSQNLKTLKLGNLRFGQALYLFPSVLTKITIIECPLDSDHFKILGKLPNLRIPKINDPRIPDNLGMLSVMAGEFPQFEVFQMIHFGLQRWEMEMNAMPNLQRLIIKRCPYLRNLPRQLWSLTHLRLVEVYHCLSLRIRGLNIKAGCKVIIS
ncbi:hypothetical protein FEM48_Zijuj12G0187400 [Ziziphus jujuba var. spinosa]|uniref:Disease resistance RPP13-like protein 3 n=1 Tax=Ziziphus jujuba var. spinosa TaxID=714518 RepID=A0A978UEX5_ZIZJJ|nr:hypothetical protein FEM48_Zijuj12G0187400 [Ziziphus jujuba var. spinosa]